MNHLKSLALLWLLFLALGLSPAQASGSSATVANSLVSEFPLPWKGAGPLAVAVAPDGKVWFTENNASSIGSFDPETGSWQSYRVPSIPSNSSFPEIHSQMYGIAIDGQGNVWFTSWLGDQVVQFDPQTLSFTPYVLGPEALTLANKEPFGLLIQGQNVWFSEINAREIGRIDTSDGNVTTFIAPCACSVGDLAAGPGGAIWFTIPESGVGKLGIFNSTTAQFKVFEQVSFDNGQYNLEEPTGIVADAQGRMWLTDHASDTVNEFDPAAKFQNGSLTGFWNLPLPGIANRTEPYGIAAGDGKVWFTEANANRVGMIDPVTDKMTEYVIPTANAVPEGVAVDQEGRAWFAELAGNELGMVDPNNGPPFNVSATSSQVSIGQGETSAINLTLSTSSDFSPGGPIKVWEVGLPYQYVSYYLGETAELPGNRTSFQLLLHASGSLPKGRYVITLSVSTSYLVQDVIVDVNVTGPTLLQQLLGGYGAYIGIAAVTMALAIAYAMRRRRAVRRLSKASAYPLGKLTSGAKRPEQPPIASLATSVGAQFGRLFNHALLRVWLA